MADKVKKTNATAKPRKTAASKTAAKNGKVAQSPKLTLPSRAEIEQLARQYWAQRGYTDGQAEQDWLRAEQELLQMAS
jgi:S-adenosylmethionine synthetase